MDINKLLEETKTKLQKSVLHFEEELKKIRSGRASASMLDGVIVEAYGSQVPLNQLASILSPEPQLLQITPFDLSTLQSISSAIRENQNLGLNPMDDGRVVRLVVPPLTEERRQEIVKQLNNKLETCLITMRQTRHEAFHRADQAKKNREISENDLQRIERQIDEAMNKQKAEVEKLAKIKEQEIITL